MYIIHFWCQLLFYICLQIEPICWELMNTVWCFSIWIRPLALASLRAMSIMRHRSRRRAERETRDVIYCSPTASLIAFLPPSVSLSHMRQIASLTDSQLTVHVWGGEVKGLNLLVALTYPSNFPSFFFLSPSVKAFHLDSCNGSKKANSRWYWMCSFTDLRNALPFLSRLLLKGLLLYSTAHSAAGGAWKRGPFSSICLKATGLCDNLKALSY